MAFYSPDAAMDQRLNALVRRLADERGEALAEALSITWLRCGQSLLTPECEAQGASAVHAAAPDCASSARGACRQGSRLRDPGDLVQLVFLIASERWLQRGLLEEEPELRRALRAMLQLGSHDATSYVVDRLSGTTSGPALADGAAGAWIAQRRLVDGWLASLGWPELEGWQAAQKTWQDGPYGRERQFLGPARENANRGCSDGLARLLEGVLSGTLVSPPACQRMRSLMSVPTPHHLAALATPAGAGWTRFWAIGGRQPGSPGLALYGEGEGHEPALLVVLLDPAAIKQDEGLLDGIVADLFGVADATG